MKKRAIGYNGPFVSEIGLGCVGMSRLYGNADRSESIATIWAFRSRGGYHSPRSCCTSN
ncbi:hypothetical protein AA0X95_17315 [Bacillus sp. 1P10SD]|uniref:hypothetical protein n=1 Tax=Bacillus sp. 1P10SD TaxID=3132265 RepID=UPI0039A7026E